MFLDQKDECTGDFIYVYGHKQVFLYRGRGVDGRGVVEDAQLPRGFCTTASKTTKFGQAIRLVARETVIT